MQQFKRLSFRPGVLKDRTIYTFPNISVAKFGPKASKSVYISTIYMYTVKTLIFAGANFREFTKIS